MTAQSMGADIDIYNSGPVYIESYLSPYILLVVVGHGSKTCYCVWGLQYRVKPGRDREG